MIRTFDYEKDSDEINRWGAKHKFPLPPKDFLPDVGIMANDAAVGFLYMSNSKMAWIEWVFANPDKSAEERASALNLVMHALEQIAIVRGVKALFTAAGTQAYRDVVERNHFQETDKDITHHIKLIGRVS